MYVCARFQELAAGSVLCTPYFTSSNSDSHADQRELVATLVRRPPSAPTGPPESRRHPAPQAPSTAPEPGVAARWPIRPSGVRGDQERCRAAGAWSGGLAPSPLQICSALRQLGEIEMQLPRRWSPADLKTCLLEPDSCPGSAHSAPFRRLASVQTQPLRRPMSRTRDAPTTLRAARGTKQSVRASAEAQKRVTPDARVRWAPP